MTTCLRMYHVTSWRSWCFLVLTGWLLMLLISIPTVSGIGCFVCTSINGSEPECEDTFNNTGKFYREECFSGRKGRSGLFPGTECIKFKAQHGDGYEILVRQCVVDNGDVNSESEIGRLDHCGFINWIKFQGDEMSGCILACDSDGCNTANRSGYSWWVILTVALVTFT